MDSSALMHGCTVPHHATPPMQYGCSVKLPGQRDGSPMDLSAPRATEAESDSGSESGQAAQPARRGGLSLVRPEILFGENKPASLSERLEENSHEEPSTPEVQPSPLSLLSSLSDLAPKGDGSVNAMANTMKVTSQLQYHGNSFDSLFSQDAFREVLKLPFRVHSVL